MVDLRAQYDKIGLEIDNAINSVLMSTAFIKGPDVKLFEEELQKYMGVKHVVSCANGTDALHLAMMVLGLKPGDEVIVPALTWIATAEAVNNVGAEPVFVDVNSLNYTIDFKSIERQITKKTKAIIPVHLYGCPADMNEIIRIAEKFGLYVIEDCAQAHGAEYFGKKVGTFGIASAFSFFPSKNLGAFGDGGAIVTNNKELADLSKEISNHGQLNKKHKHLMIGRNSRLDSIQASILRV